MLPTAKIYVAGHRGLVGSALVRGLAARGYDNLALRTHAELDLTDAAAVRGFFAQERPEYVFLAAAKVGGILANDTYPVPFIEDNLLIQGNVIREAWRAGVRRLMFLGSSCIYPRLAPQPLREEYLLTGSLEPTNRPYALAKIAGIELCWSYNRQYGTRFLAMMPTNLYGPGDNYDLEKSHVIPALIRKFHEAKVSGTRSVTVWGTGAPRREFLYSDDMAEGCIHVAASPDEDYSLLLGDREGRKDVFRPPLVNIGVGEDLTIRDLALVVQEVVGFDGDVVFDTSKPDGTPRKLMDCSRMASIGWRAKTSLRDGLTQAYADYLQRSGQSHGSVPSPRLRGEG
jgi:GDP-L-fucose synthase